MITKTARPYNQNFLIDNSIYGQSSVLKKQPLFIFVVAVSHPKYLNSFLVSFDYL